MSRKSRLPKLDFGEIDEQATTILFDEQQQAVPSRRILLEIPVDSIDPNPHQVRRRFNQATLEQLADTMREDVSPVSCVCEGIPRIPRVTNLSTVSGAGVLRSSSQPILLPGSVRSRASSSRRQMNKWRKLGCWRTSNGRISYPRKRLRGCGSCWR